MSVLCISVPYLYFYDLSVLPYLESRICHMNHSTHDKLKQITSSNSW